MALAPVPSNDEVVRLYEAGGLLEELAQFHETGKEDENDFVQQCVALHNARSIDLVSLPTQAAFAALNTHEFFTLQHFYCEAIPHLHISARELMECCRILVERGGNDLAANQPNGAFRAWCKNNPDQAATLIEEAQAGDTLAKRFVTFALQARNDIDVAIELGNAPDFVDIGEAGVAVVDAMRHQRCDQLGG